MEQPRIGGGQPAEDLLQAPVALLPQPLAAPQRHRPEPAPVLLPQPAHQA
ncbi:hypothetical protein [Streptomyces sp. NPDC049585]